MKKLILVLFFVLTPMVVHAEPWVVSGQTDMPAPGGIDDPLPANSGALGAVTQLPYTVPAGKVLCVKAYGVEGYDAPGIMVIFLWTGAPYEVSSQWRIEHGLPSVGASNGSNEFVGLNFCFPAGTLIHVRLLNGTQQIGVYGWYVTGELIDE